MGYAARASMEARAHSLVRIFLFKRTSMMSHGLHAAVLVRPPHACSDAPNAAIAHHLGSKAACAQTASVTHAYL